MTSSVIVGNKKGILVLGKGPRQKLDNTTLNAEAEQSVNFTEQGKIFFYIPTEATGI